MKKLHFGMPVLVALVVALALTIAPAASPATTADATSPAAATGLVQNLTGTVGNLTYDLTATITRFANQGGQLVAVGTVTGTVTNTLTGVITTVNQAFSVPVTLLQANGSCTILDLTLGPLHLDLLGLVVGADRSRELARQPALRSRERAQRQPGRWARGPAQQAARAPLSDTRPACERSCPAAPAGRPRVSLLSLPWSPS